MVLDVPELETAADVQFSFSKVSQQSLCCITDDNVDVINI